MRGLGILVLLVMLAGCGHGGGGEGAGGPARGGKQLPPPEVVVQRVRRGPVTVYREFTAQTVASDSVNIRPQVSGRLLSFSFREGSPVEAGQVLFQIDPTDYQAQVDQALASVSKARADLQQARTQVSVKQAQANLAAAQTDLRKAQLYVDRYKPLAAKQIIPQQQYDDAVSSRDAARAQVVAMQAALQNAQISTRSQIEVAQSQLAAAQAQLTQARTSLGYCTITTPIDGIIGQVQAYPGTVVAPGSDTLVTISRSNPIYVNFNISESDYLNVVYNRSSDRSAGPLPIELILGNGRTYGHTGSITMADRTLNAQTGTLLIRTQFPNPRQILKPGQFARVRIPAVRRDSAILIPQQAVIELQSLETVLLVDDQNRVSSRTITLENAAVGEDFIVASGLEGGERIIVDGTQKVQPGMVCKPIPAGK